MQWSTYSVECMVFNIGAHTDRAYPGYGIPYTLQPVTLLGSYIHCRLLSISEAHRRGVA